MERLGKIEQKFKIPVIVVLELFKITIIKNNTRIKSTERSQKYRE